MSKDHLFIILLGFKGVFPKGFCYYCCCYCCY